MKKTENTSINETSPTAFSHSGTVCVYYKKTISCQLRSDISMGLRVKSKTYKNFPFSNTLLFDRTIILNVSLISEASWTKVMAALVL